MALACTKSEENAVVDDKGELALEKTGLSLSNEQFQAAEMRLGKIQMKVFNDVLRVNGVLDVPPTNRASVSAYFGGYVKKINILPGQKIAKGQTLFTIENPEYVTMQQEFLESQGQLAYLKDDYERQKLLAEQNVSSKKNYLKAEADYMSIWAQFSALQKQLELISINTKALNQDNIQSVIAVKSPIDGFVNMVHAERGMYLNPQDVAVTITNTDHLHLELNVYEKDFLKIALKQPIVFKLADSPKVYSAYVYLIGKSIDTEMRTLRVHGHLTEESEGQKFAPGMYVQADIITQSDSALALPENAIVSLEDKNYVLIRSTSNADKTVFEKRAVQIGRSTNGQMEILNHADFDSNTEFLINGAFNLISE